MSERPNEQFFQYQRTKWEESVASKEGGGLSSFFGSAASTPPFSGLDSFAGDATATALRQEILQHVNTYLTSIGQTAVDQSNVNIFLWATVHDRCIGHLPHIHEVGVVSCSCSKPATFGANQCFCCFTIAGLDGVRGGISSHA